MEARTDPRCGLFERSKGERSKGEAIDDTKAEDGSGAEDWANLR